MSPTLFDRTLLPEALGEFVVISDTHYALAGGVGMSEFPSRAKQSRASGRGVASWWPPWSRILSCTWAMWCRSTPGALALSRPWTKP